MDNAKVVKEIIEKNVYCCMATVSAQNKPWASTVSYCVNDELEFFFQSAMDCNHIDNLRNMPEACVSIYDSSISVEFIDGVQMYGLVEMIDESEVEEVYNLFISQVIPEEDRSRLAPPMAVFKNNAFPFLRFFRFVPTEIYRKDLTINGVARRVKVDVNAVREAFKEN